MVVRRHYGIYVIELYLFLAMKRLRDAGDFENGLKVYSIMKSKGVKPDRIAYSFAISLHTKSSMYSKAISIYEEFRRNGGILDVLLLNVILEPHYRLKKLSFLPWWEALYP